MNSTRKIYKSSMTKSLKNFRTKKIFRSITIWNCKNKKKPPDKILKKHLMNKQNNWEPNTKKALYPCNRSLRLKKRISWRTFVCWKTKFSVFPVWNHLSTWSVRASIKINKWFHHFQLRIFDPVLMKSLNYINKLNKLGHLNWKSRVKWLNVWQRNWTKWIKETKSKRMVKIIKKRRLTKEPLLRL